jgi:cell division protein FtsW
MKIFKPSLSRRDTFLDETLLWAVILLATIGLVMVYSASVAVAEASAAMGHNGFFFLTRHALNLGIACLMGYMAFRVDTATWKKYAPILFLLGLVLLAAVLVPGIGRVVNGSRRWISLGPLTVQPSEFMKLFVIIYAADYTSRKFALMQDLKRGFLPLFGAIVVAGGLLLMEPDFGAFIVIVSVALATLFLGGMRIGPFIGMLSLLSVAFVGIMVTSPYRMARFMGFLDPWADPTGKGYQLSHSLIAIGRGELTGVGLGNSVEKLFYLPEAHTDFILAVIGEEFGFLGLGFVILLFGVVLFRAFHIGMAAAKMEKYFTALMAFGIGMWVGIQATINVGVNVGLLPTKGLTLPLISYGGSSLMAGYMAIGVLMRIDQENRKLMARPSLLAPRRASAQSHTYKSHSARSAASRLKFEKLKQRIGLD